MHQPQVDEAIAGKTALRTWVSPVSRQLPTDHRFGHVPHDSSMGHGTCPAVGGPRNVLYPPPGITDLAVFVTLLGVFKPMTFQLCVLWFYLPLYSENSGVMLGPCDSCHSGNNHVCMSAKSTIAYSNKSQRFCARNTYRHTMCPRGKLLSMET